MNSAATPPPPASDRIDYDKGGNLDDVVVTDVSMFHMEWMADDTVWIKCYRDGKPDVVFWLSSAGNKISGRHGFDD